MRPSSVPGDRMTVLVVQLPPRPRPKTRDGDTPPAGEVCGWVSSVDGRSVAQHGEGPPSEWPPAERVLLVPDPADVGWLGCTLPRAGAARMRQALLGVLEDQLLDDEETLHFALPPEAAAGRPAWVAVLHKPWLAGWLQRLEAVGRNVERVVPLLPPPGGPGAPGGPARGHFAHEPTDDGERLRLLWSDDAGAACLGLEGTLARHRVAAAAGAEGAQFTATPAAAAAAEAWLGQPVGTLGEAELLLQQAAPGGWNLRQFDLAPRHRGATALREAGRRFLSPAWRPVHVGLAALVVVNLVGLNAWAWTQQRALAGKRQAALTLLRETHPQVRAILDAPRQMARENELLRAAAGQAGDADLETLLGVAAAGWPEDEAPVGSLQFEPGRLVLGIDGWDDARVAEFRERVAPAGWSAQAAGGKLTLARGTAP